MQPMPDYSLPSTTAVKRVIPKNSFESFATPKQRRLFTEIVRRITWTHKVSPSTTNLKANKIQEIQFFSVELKKSAPVKELLDLIDRCIPYPIVFKVTFGEEFYFHTSIKRQHAQDEDKAIIDFSLSSTFGSDFFLNTELRVSIDEVYRRLCLQLSDFAKVENMTMEQLIARQGEVNGLRKEIGTLRASIRKSKSFKEKVDLNQRLTVVERQLSSI